MRIKICQLPTHTARKISSLKYLTSHVPCHLTVQGEGKFAVIVYLGLLSNLIG